MANTIRLTITQKAVDVNENILSEDTEILSSSFENKSTGSFSLSAGSAFKSIAFGQVVTASVLSIKSTEELTVKLNGGTQEITASTLLLRGSFTSIQVKNPSSSDSDVEYEVFGT